MPDIRIVLAALGLVVMTGSAFAQSDAAPPAPPKRTPVVADPTPAAAQAPDAILPPPQLVASGQPLEVDTHPVDPRAVNAADKATLDQINSYFNSMRFFSGKFTQIGSDGQRITGLFWVSKPGRMRFDYNAPSSLQLLADGTSVAVRNRKLNTQDLYLISQTPLRFLLADRLDLIKDSRVIAVGREPEGISVVLEEKSSIGGSAKIQLSFPAPNYALRQWTITDAQGYDTTVMISDIDTSLRLPDKIFYIDQTRVLK